jgi:CubicO group peptidase (beta-lactamase class C family)
MIEPLDIGGTLSRQKEGGMKRLCCGVVLVGLAACSNDVDSVTPGADAGASAGAGGTEAGAGGSTAGNAGTGGATAGNGGSAPGRYDHLKSVIDQINIDEKLGGIAVAVIENGELAWSTASGHKTTPVDQPVTTSLFRSGNYWATAIALLQLSRAGKVDLDAPVKQYVPELDLEDDPPELALITARQLLTHQSGLTHGYHEAPVWTDYDTCLAGDSALTDYFTGNDPFYFTHGEHIEFPPGRGFHGSAPAGTLLTLVIERASGIPYREYVTKNVLDPLGMTRSFFEWADVYADGDYANALAMKCCLIQGMGGLFAPVGELVKVAKFMFDGNPAVLSEEDRALLTTHYGNLSPTTEYPENVGLGWTTSPGLWLPDGFHDTGVESVQTGIWWNGTNGIYLVTSMKFGVIYSTVVGKLAGMKILQTAYQDLLGVSKPDPVAPIKEDPAGIGKYLGTYWSPAAGHNVTLVLEGQELKMAWGLYHCLLTPTWAHTFTCDQPSFLHDGGEVRFWMDGNGDPEYLVTGGWVAKKISSQVDAGAD